MSFSQQTVDRFCRAVHQGLDRTPEALGMAGSYKKGYFVVIGLTFHEGVIVSARFRSFNCLPAIAAADWLCETVEGITGDSALTLTVEQISQALGGIPARKMFCLQLAYDALAVAVREAQKKGILL